MLAAYTELRVTCFESQCAYQYWKTTSDSLGESFPASTRCSSVEIQHTHLTSKPDFGMSSQPDPENKLKRKKERSRRFEKATRGNGSEKTPEPFPPDPPPIGSGGPDGC